MIEVEHLSKTYGSTPAIEDVTLTVHSGEILGFLGPNGAGKTTTMRILAGYLPGNSGEREHRWLLGVKPARNPVSQRNRVSQFGVKPARNRVSQRNWVSQFIEF